MANIKERIAYLQGLANGLKLNDAGREGQVLAGVLEVLDAMAVDLAQVEDNQEDLEAYVESIDSDLTDLEEDYYGDAVATTAVWQFSCPNCGLQLEVEQEGGDEDERLELVCPACGQVLHETESGFEVEARSDQNGRKTPVGGG
ncbi:MAG: zinc ribbon domain-containing protein [Clostridia bacterium]|nr:zinc ribbon domain-containing protein [Clostridia bacterium]